MKKISRILLVAMIAILIVVACACASKTNREDEEEKGSDGYSLTFSLHSDGYVVTGIENPDNVTSITVPATHDGESVYAIGSNAFESCADLETIKLPESLTEIGQAAFKDCTSLDNVVIPNSVTVIYSDAFSGCTSLAIIRLSDNLESIADIFDGCTSLKSITIPAATSNIYDNPFKKCENLTSVTVDPDNESYSSEGGVLYNKDKTGLVLAVTSTASIDIPDTVTSIASHAFYNCKKLTSIELPGSVNSIGESAFENCTSLSNISYTPDGWYSCSSNIFSGCNYITEAALPFDMFSSLPKPRLLTKIKIAGNSSSSIYANAFKDYVSLESVDISVNRIGQNAFSGLNKLTSVTLSGVTRIEKGAFSYCNNLNKVNYTGDLQKWCEIDFDDYSANPVSYAHDLYINGELLTELDTSGISEIKKFAFYGCDGLTKVNIASGTTRIGEKAFKDCDKLTEVRADSLTDWCYIDFYDGYANPLSYAHNLYINGEPFTEFDGAEVDEIKNFAFYGCESLTKISIPDWIVGIGRNAFVDCKNITEAVLPAGFLSSIHKDNLHTVTVTSGAIGARAFKDSAKLSSVTLMDGVTKIGSEAFSGCRSLERITVPSSVGSIDSKAFKDCAVLESVEIQGSVNTIRSETFSGCAALAEFAVPQSVTKIERNAFYGCKTLTQIDISSSVTDIEQGAFGMCENLHTLSVDPANPNYSSLGGILYDKAQTTIYFVPTSASGTIALPSTLVTIGDYAFSGCDKITGIEIPSGVASIGDGAFNGTGITRIEIPNTVSAVGVDAFENCNITEATLPAQFIPSISKASLNTVTVTGGAIGENAFSGCAELTSVTLSGVTEIGDHAFSGCAITGIEIPSSVLSIGEGAFKDTCITRIEIPDTVSAVGGNAFENCNITEATLPAKFIPSIPKASLSTVTVTGGVIPDNAFSDCVGLSAVTLSGVTEIGDHAFSGCAGMTGIEIPGSVASIGDGAFKGAGITRIEIPETVSAVGGNAFENCAITEATLPAKFIPSIPKSRLSTVTVTGGAIPDNAFSGCAELSAVTLSDGVTEIGNSAFRGCAVTGMEIPSSVTIIGEAVFVGCSSLSGITVNANNPYFSVRNGILYREDDRHFLDILFAPVSISGKVTITDSVRRIGSGAFYGCDKITGLDIVPVNDIGDDAFYGCNNIVEARLYAHHISAIDKTKLRKVEIYSGAIPENAFNGCAALSDITIKNTYYGIGRGAFVGTAYYADESNWVGNILYIDKCLIVARSSVSGDYAIRAGTELIADGAFDGCVGLTGIEIPSSIEHIGDGTFDGCDNIVNAKLPLAYISLISKDKLQTLEVFGSGEIADNEFKNITTLKSLKVSDGVTAIGREAFNGCAELATVDIADSVVYIGDGAFDGTAFINNDGNYEGGVLYIGNSLIVAKTTLSGNYDIKNNTVRISSGAFKDCTLLTGVTIPGSVTSIGEQVFDGCIGLKSVTVAADNAEFGSYGGILYDQAQTALLFVPHAISGEVSLANSLSSIPDSAFYGCADITAVHIPDSVLSIGNSAFYGCSALGSIDIPNSVTSIGDGAFYGCTSLNTVSVSNNVKTFGSGVFTGCDNIVSATMPGQPISEITKAKLKTAVVTGGEIAAEAFKDCASLTGVTLSDGVTAIGSYAFSGCTGITEIEIPRSVTQIGDGAFNKCRITAATLSAQFTWAIPKTLLQTVTVTDGEIDVGAFKDCNSLSSVNIDGVTAIKLQAFMNCTSLTSVTIPSSVTSIGEEVFYGCSSMESIAVDPGNTKYRCENGILYSVGYLHTVYAPAKLGGAVEINSAAMYIDKSAFRGCTEITGVVIHENVAFIYQGAFEGCTKLASVRIESTNVSVRSAFGGCTAITDVFAPDAVFIGSESIRRSNLETVNIISGSVGGQMFKNCAKLTDVTLAEGVTGLGKEAFSGCTSLVNITIPSTVTSISDYAFNGCVALSSITVPTAVTSIGNYAFNGCAALNSIDIPNSVSSLGNYAFSGCDMIANITIPNSVTSIGDCAFAECAILSDVNVPKSVTTVGTDIFNGSDNIVSATVPGALTSQLPRANLETAVVVSGKIPDNAFMDCKALKSITIGADVTDSGSGAFRGCTNVESVTVEEGNKVFFVGANGILYEVVEFLGKEIVTVHFAFKLSAETTKLDLSNVYRIMPYAFEENENITYVDLGNIDYIGEHAFKNCTNLKTVKFFGTCTVWEGMVNAKDVADTWRAGTQIVEVQCTDDYYSYGGVLPA